MSHTKSPLRSSSEPIDRLSGDDEALDLGFMTPNATVKYVRKDICSELYTDQGVSIRDQLKFASKHIDVRRHFHVDRLSDDMFKIWCDGWI